jgi:hypothetical protein
MTRVGSTVSNHARAAYAMPAATSRRARTVVDHARIRHAGNLMPSQVLDHSSATGQRRVRQRAPAGVHPGQRRPEETTVSTDLRVVRMRRIA